MEKILTVVVPTYNAEKYLRDNLESFCIEELLDDIDILVVNDGSTDGSLNIANEYAEQYPNSYRVITKTNGGHGSGINCGIAYAKGKYFKVVDADDWVEREPFKELVNTLKSQDADVVYSGFLWAFDNGQADKDKYETKAETLKAFEGVAYQTQYKFDEIASKLYIKMHNMTIKTEVLRQHQITIDENCYYVDTEYIMYPIPYINTICFVDAFVYMYRIGRTGQSVSMERMQKNQENYDRVLASLLKFYSKLGTEIPCTSSKKSYIAGIIARVAAGKIKIMLSFPAAKEKKLELRRFDENLKQKYPEIYHGNINKAVSLLRKSRYVMYYPASMLVRKRFR